jgi:hypothetical protein
MSNLSEWIDMQRRLVDHGSRVTTIRLRGPDGDVWGTWPVETEDLADAIVATMAMLQDGMPKGSYQVKVWAYDAADREVSMLPDTLRGRSQSATSAASEQLTLQKSTAAALYNAKVMNEGLAQQVAQLNQALESLQSSNLELMSTVTNMAAQTAERDIADMRRDALNDALITVGRWVEKNSDPLLTMLLAKFGPKLLPPEQQPTTESADAEAAKPEPAAPPEPTEPPEPANVKQQPAAATKPDRRRDSNGGAQSKGGQTNADRGHPAGCGNRTSSSRNRARTGAPRPRRAARKP